MTNVVKVDRSLRPVTHPVPQLPIPQVNRTFLNNGIELVTLDTHSDSQVTRIIFSWENGSWDARYLPESILAAQLVINGNSSLSSLEMADLIDYSGATVGTDISSHNNSVSILALQRNIDKILPPIVECINAPLFPTDEFNTLRERLGAARATEEVKVTFQAERLDLLQCFGAGHPATKMYTQADMQNGTIDKTIDTHHFLKGIQPPVVFVVGALTPAFMNILTTELEKIACTPGSLPSLNIVPPHPGEASKPLFHNMPDSLQSAIRISIPTVSRANPEYQRIRLMTIALGGYFGSRLMTNIREEKGLTYGINAALFGYREGSFINISCQCDNKYVEEVIKEVNNEIEKLATQPMDDEELETVRQIATGSLLSTLDTPFNVMDYYVTQRHVRTPDNYFELQQEAIREMNPMTIMDTTARYLADKPKLISVAGKM